MTNRTRGVLLLLWPLSSCYSPNDTIATGPEGAEGSSSGSSSGGPTGEGTGTDTDTSASASSTSPGPDSDNEALATLAHGVDVDAAGVAYVGGLAEYGGNLGAHGWVRAYDDAAALVFDHDAGPEVFDVGVSDDGNAALVGSLIALLGIEGEPLGPLQTRRLAPDGDTLWTEDLESFPYLEPYAQRLAVDSEENIIVVANFREGTSAQAWARKFSPNGTVNAKINATNASAKMPRRLMKSRIEDGGSELLNPSPGPFSRVDISCNPSPGPSPFRRLMERGVKRRAEVRKGDKNLLRTKSGCQTLANSTRNSDGKIETSALMATAVAANNAARMSQRHWVELRKRSMAASASVEKVDGTLSP